jgi:hypothetical protein
MGMHHQHGPGMDFEFNLVGADDLIATIADRSGAVAAEQLLGRATRQRTGSQAFAHERSFVLGWIKYLGCIVHGRTPVGSGSDHSVSHQRAI